MSPSVNSLEESTKDLLDQIDLIDQRVDSLWEFFAGADSGPPPELDVICRWGKVKVTVADVVAQHLGYDEDSESLTGSEQGGESVENFGQRLSTTESDLSVDSDDSYRGGIDLQEQRQSAETEEKNISYLKDHQQFRDINLSHEITREAGNIAAVDDSGFVVSSDRSNPLVTRADSDENVENKTNIVTVFVEHHIYRSHKDALDKTSDDKNQNIIQEMVPLSQDVNLFLNDDMYFSEKEYFNNSEDKPYNRIPLNNNCMTFNDDRVHADSRTPHGSSLSVVDSGIYQDMISNGRIKDTHQNVDEIFPYEDLEKIEMGLDSQDQVVPDSIAVNRHHDDQALKNTWESPGRVSGQEKNDSTLRELPLQASAFLVDDIKDDEIEMEDKVTPIGVEPSLTIEEAESIPEDDLLNIISGSEISEDSEVPNVNDKYRAKSRPLGGLGIVETPKKVIESEFHVLDETESGCNSPSSSALGNKRVPRYHQRKNSRLNFDSPVPALIKRSNEKKKAEECNDMRYRRKSNAMEKLNMNYRRGIRPSSWPETRHDGVDKLDILVEIEAPGDGALSLAARPGISVHFSDVFNESGYLSTGDLDKDVEASRPEQQVVPVLNLTRASLTDVEPDEDDGVMTQPVDNHLLMTPPRPGIGLARSPPRPLRLTPALTPRIEIVDEKGVTADWSRFNTPRRPAAPRRLSSLSMKSPVLRNQTPLRLPRSLSPGADTRMLSPFVIGALAAAPQLSRRRLPRQQALSGQQ